MSTFSLRERSATAARILSASRKVANSVTDEFLARHPDWVERYGERARKHGVEDAVYHQSYLACAIEAGSTAPFVEYARWTVNMLSARNIAAHFVSENLEQIRLALREHLSPVENGLAGEYIQAARDACLDAASPAPPEAAGEPRSETAMALKLYLQAAIHGDRKAAANIALEALKQAPDVVDLYIGLFQAAQYEVGRLWQENRITVAEEHMATAITQYVMARIYSRFDGGAPERGRVVITGIEGELHQVGANMVADVLEARGWNVRFLGTNMPQQGILQAVEDHKADTVGISATMLLSIPKVVDLVEGLRGRFPSSPRILLGGRAFTYAPQLVEELNAVGAATDLRSALALL